MNTQAIEKYIDATCSQLNEKIQQEDNIGSDYRTKLENAPALIQAQAKASLNTAENRTGINLLVTVFFSQQFIDYMRDLDQEYSNCSSQDKMIISKKQLAPFQISLLAKQLALAPGIIKQYEDIKNNN